MLIREGRSFEIMANDARGGEGGEKALIRGRMPF